MATLQFAKHMVNVSILQAVAELESSQVGRAVYNLPHYSPTSAIIEQIEWIVGLLRKIRGGAFEPSGSRVIDKGGEP